MRLKKFISGSLALGILLNSIPINSFANALSEDYRYETFEGSSIKIDDVLEEDKVDVKIEGNTLVNKLGWVTKKNNNSTIVDDTKKTIAFNKPVTEFNYHVTFENATVEVDKTYTLVFNILKNTLENTSGYSSLGRFNILSYNKGNHPINFGETGLVKVVLTQPSTSSNIKPFLEIYKECEGELIIEKPYLLEGDWTNKELPDYFEGIKSVGKEESNTSSIKIISQNQNLFNTNNLYVENFNGPNNNATFNVSGDSIFISKKTHPGNFVGTRIECKKGQPYTIGFVGGTNKSGSPYFIYLYSDKIWGNEILKISNPSDTEYVINTFTPTTDEFYIGLYMGTTTEIGEVLEFKNVFVNEGNISNYSRYQENSINLLFKEPLRGIEGVAKDKIIKKNGQWYIERNCGEITLNGSENWGYNKDGETSQEYYLVIDNILPLSININDKFISRIGAVNNSEYIRINDKSIVISLFSDIKNNSYIKRWLADNPVTVIYALNTPIYEPLNMDSVLSLYENTTYISNSSNIPATMEVTVDRTMNRAVEAIELAKTNPTTENLSRARYWNNLLKESNKKDELQGEVDSITNISDMVLDMKTATSNLDIYIKCENILQMSLDTNQISFDDFSGIEDVEKLNAVNLTINSSLPYQINAYLPTEIQNSDKTKTLDKSILNIKENSESAYQIFSNTTDKIVLKDNCSSGNQLTHGVDLKLFGGIAHEKDVYKAIIKLEVEQK